VEQIQDGLKTDPVVSFIYGVNCEMKQIQDSPKADPVITSLTYELKMKQIQDRVNLIP
jgi:hypothetical protein